MPARGEVGPGLVDVPAAGRGRWGGGPEDAALMAFLFEVRAVGVLGADRLTVWPDREIGLEPARPQLIAARPGLLVDFRTVPLILVGRIDFSEPARPLFDLETEGTLVTIDAVLDDFYAWWRPSVGAQLVAGRMRVPFARARLVEEVEEPFGAPPFIVDRIAPDRRWGAALAGSAGPLAYIAGAYADLDDLEPRERLDDTSLGGAAALAATVEWTSPSYGARGPLPARRTDPGFSIGQLALAAGGLLRVREDGTRRFDATLSAQTRWKALAGLVEGIASSTGSDGDGLVVGGHATLLATPIDRLVLGARAEIDPGASGGGTWSVSASVGWHVTKDRRNRIAVVGWVKRDEDRGTPFDGVVVFLQANL